MVVSSAITSNALPHSSRGLRKQARQGALLECSPVWAYRQVLRDVTTWSNRFSDLMFGLIPPFPHGFHWP